LATELQYRQAMGRALDDLNAYAVSAGSSTTVASAFLVNNTTNASTTRYNGRWCYISSGTAIGQLRRVRSNGYAPSTGTLTTTPDWGVSPAASDTLELTSLFPAIPSTLGEDTDYRSILNRALALLMIADRIAPSITTGTVSLATWPWLDRDERLVRILEPSPVSGRAPVDSSWRGWRLVLDGEAAFLEPRIPFASASGALTLEVLRPANTWIRTGGTWTETSPASGLAGDTTEAVPSIDEVRTVGLMVAYEALMNRTTGQPNGDWAKRWATQNEMAHRLLRFDATRERVAVAPEAGAA
jgi:hypothetical protein